MEIGQKKAPKIDWIRVCKDMLNARSSNEFVGLWIVISTIVVLMSIIIGIIYVLMVLPQVFMLVVGLCILGSMVVTVIVQIVEAMDRQTPAE